MTAIESPCIIQVITDYGSDNAVNEVIPKLRKYFGFGSVEILNNTILNFNTINNAFWIAQHALNAELPTLIYHNVAPRKDDKSSRADNRGEELLGIKLDNGVVIVGPNSGFSHSLVLDHIVECVEIFVGGKSQFRSRDVFIEPAALYWRGDPHLETISVDPHSIIPKLESDVVLHIDNYGNIKTNITDIESKVGDEVEIKIGTFTTNALVAGGAFQQKEGQIGFVPGSSGWDDFKFYELFYRGGRADTQILKESGITGNVDQVIKPGDEVVVSHVGSKSVQQAD